MKEKLERFDTWLREPHPMFGVKRYVPIVIALLLILVMALSTL